MTQMQTENKKKTIGILQPGSLPWLGFFEQVFRSDIFVIYDDVQYDKHCWRNRNRIKSPAGIQWLTVPVLFSLKIPVNVKDVKIDQTRNWQKKHLASIKQNYSKSEYYKNYIDIFENAYSKNWEFLIDLDMFFITKIIEILGIRNKRIEFSSQYNIIGNKLEKLVQLCKKFDAEIFYEGAAGKNYIDEKVFSDNNIAVIYQDYKHPEYKQLYGEFIPYLSIIDLLFNEGGKSLEISVIQP